MRICHFAIDTMYSIPDEVASKVSSATFPLVPTYGLETFPLQVSGPNQAYFSS